MTTKSDAATQPLWLDTAAIPAFKKLDRDEDVDVVVVGGGITGLTAAYLLTLEGRRVALLERARCATIDSKVGSLTPGKDADIVMLHTDRLDVWPVNNAPSTVVNLMNPSHVENVFIAGKVKKWRGALVGVDMARVMRVTQEARDALMRRVNFKVDLVG